MIINFYPLTSAEQDSFTTLTEARVNNEPVMIITQPTDSIVGVDADDLQDSLYIDYFNAITFDAGKIVVLDLDAIEALAVAKSQKQQEIDAWSTTTMATGFDTGLGFFLSYDEIKRVAYVSYSVLLEQSMQRRGRLTTSTVTILDKNEIPRQFTVNDLLETLTDYGESIESTFNTQLGFLGALAAAQTVADVDAIIVP